MSEPLPPKHENTPQRRPRVTKEKRLLRALWDTILERLPSPLVKYLKKEYVGVKRGWHFFCVIAVVLAITILVGCKWYYASQIADLNNTVKTVKEERDTHMLALQPWQALASSIYTNVPPSERLQMLADQVSAMTNTIVQVLKSSELDFEIFVNKARITNSIATVYIGRVPKPVEITTRNAGKVAANGLTITVFLAIDATNVVATNWTVKDRAIRVEHDTLEALTNYTVLKTVNHFPTGSGSLMSGSGIIFTNWNRIVVQGRIDVYSDGSQTKSVLVNFLLTDDLITDL